ncbi:MAG: hypothetical protein PHD46_03985 [Eubacteriales bacterium]|nr:hypothetical protein [Eubacteriales bacterium]MDD4422181.1 hypothetical protein [Eubacteriales bacterium]HBR31508.1 hypothetical protein [Clostridiales bacterium]
MKRITAILFVLLFILAGCDTKTEDSLTESINEMPKNQVIEWDNDSLIDTAKQLLYSDRLVTELFVGGKLTKLVDVSNKNPIDFASAAGTEYEDFTAIEKLLTKTYSIAGNTITKYLTLPKYGNRSILSVSGKTYFSFHYTEDFDGIDIESITISDGENENVKNITAGQYRIPMVYDGGVWLLEDSVYFLSREAERKPESDYVFPLMNQGTAKALTGRIMVVEIFVSDSKSSFTDEDITAFETKVSESFEYIKNAAPNGSEFEVEYEKLKFKHSKSSIIFSSEDQTNFDLVLATTDYKNLDKYINENFNTFGYDSYLAIVCVNKTGSGYAKPYTQEEADIFTAERCVMFPNDGKIALARNILSVFGAQTPSDPYLKELLTSYCKNDIMLSGDEDSVISELTAYQAGLSKQLDRQFHSFCVKTVSEEPELSVY